MRSCRWCAPRERTEARRDHRASPRHRLEGAAAAPARPPDARDDGRAAGHAAPALRLRDQHRRPPHPDGRLRPGRERAVARPLAKPRGDGLLRRARARADYDEIDTALRSGDARVALVVPPRYGADLTRGRTTTVQLVVDGSDPQVVASATNTAASLVAARSGQLLVARLRGAGGAAARVDRPSSSSRASGTTPTSARRSTSCRGSSA